MKTTSEIAIVAVIWSLTSIGMFFSLRLMLRKLREKLRRRPPTEDTDSEQQETTQQDK